MDRVSAATAAATATGATAVVSLLPERPAKDVLLATGAWNLAHGLPELIGLPAEALAHYHPPLAASGKPDTIRLALGLSCHPMQSVFTTQRSLCVAVANAFDTAFMVSLRTPHAHPQPLAPSPHCPTLRAAPTCAEARALACHGGVGSRVQAGCQAAA